MARSYELTKSKYPLEVTASRYYIFGDVFLEVAPQTVWHEMAFRKFS